MNRKSIVVLGSTGTIGVSTLNVIKQNSKNINIELLVAKNNYKLLIKQAKKFKPKKILIVNNLYYHKVKKALLNYKIKIYTGNIKLKKIVKKKN